MKIGLIGLGSMGYSLVLYILDNKISVVVFDRNSDKIDFFIIERGEVAYSLEELVANLNLRMLKAT